MLGTQPNYDIIDIFIDAGLRSIFSLAYKAGINLFVDYLSEKPDVNLLLINP